MSNKSLLEQLQAMDQPDFPGNGIEHTGEDGDIGWHFNSIKDIVIFDCIDQKEVTQLSEYYPIGQRVAIVEKGYDTSEGRLWSRTVNHGVVTGYRVYDAVARFVGKLSKVLPNVGSPKDYSEESTVGPRPIFEKKEGWTYSVIPIITDKEGIEKCFHRSDLRRLK